MHDFSSPCLWWCWAIQLVLIPVPANTFQFSHITHSHMEIRLSRGNTSWFDFHWSNRCIFKATWGSIVNACGACCRIFWISRRFHRRFQVVLSFSSVWRMRGIFIYKSLIWIWLLFVGLHAAGKNWTQHFPHWHISFLASLSLSEEIQ